MTIRAVYEGGVLRPVRPLGLAEGATVDVTIAPAEPIGPMLRPPTAEEEDYARRIRDAPTLADMFEVQKTAPPLPDGYDLRQALNENRRANGERLLFPEQGGGGL